MSAVKSAKKRVSESATSKSKKLKRVPIEDDFDLSYGIQGIVSILQKAQDGQKKNEETISSVASDIKPKFDEVQTKFEKKRQCLAKALLKSTKKCKNLLKNETANFQAIREKFRKDKTAHLQALEDTISNYEEEKGRLVIRYKQQSKRYEDFLHILFTGLKKEKNVISERKKADEQKLAELKKEKQGGKALSISGSFLDNVSGDLGKGILED